MQSLSADVAIIGGGVGGFAAALAAAESGLKVIVTDESPEVGGQLTSQAVPPDEHPWIESFGRTARYAQFRSRVRRHYLACGDFTPEQPHFNPGSGWVSNLCHPPTLARAVLNDMISPYVSGETVRVLVNHAPVSADARQGSVRSVTLQNPDGVHVRIEAKVFLDATELGDLLPLTETAFVTGFESQAETGEPLAPLEADPNDWQAITWVFAAAWDPGHTQPIVQPEGYEFWRNYRPDFWPGNLLGFTDVHPITLLPRYLPLLGASMGLFGYRKIISKDVETGALDTTAVNWPMNDYFLSTALDPGAAQASKQLSESLLFWLQTEAPRHDSDQLGYPELRLAPEATGTPDGFASRPYIRESRRIKALTTITSRDVSAADNPNRDRGTHYEDSVGVGSYRIDLHPSTGGRNYLDVASLPFEIPLRALIPVETKNLVAAAKNIGTTHITNGCYRLHPVEWNIGEAAGHLASFCVLNGVQPADVAAETKLLRRFRAEIAAAGIQISWPQISLQG